MNELEKVLKALANKRRLMILKFLQRGRASVGDIADAIKLSFKATSRHLTLLTSADILEKEQEGLVVWHQLKRQKHPVVIELLRHL